MPQGAWLQFLAFLAACTHTSPCERESEAKDWAAALRSCSDELRATGDHVVAVAAAQAAYHLHRYDDVDRFARLALGTDRDADARTLIGQAAFRRGARYEALAALGVALVEHMAAGDDRAQSRDAHQLAGVWFELGDYRAALAAEELGRAAAGRARDDRMMFYLDVARADILRTTGDMVAAEGSINVAVAEATVAEDRVVGALKQAILDLEIGRPALARARLEQALAAENTLPQPRPLILQSAWLNLAYLDRSEGLADRALEEVEAARRSGIDDVEYHLNHGLVVAELGRLDDAAADLSTAEAAHPEGRWSWWVPYQRALIEVRRGNIDAAIAADRRAIGAIAQLAGRTGPHGATLVATHRAPHEHLIGLLARRAAWRDALEVIASMDAVDVLDAPDDPRPFLPDSAERPAPTTLRRRPRTAGDAAAILAAWRAERLAIVVPGGDRMWRLDVRDGDVRGSDVGDVHRLGELALRLERDPDEREAAGTIGDAMVPADLLPGERLAVLPIGPLARAPLAMLRWHDAPLFESVAVVRATAITPRLDPIAAATARAVVLGDPADNLPDARNEAIWVARRLAVEAHVGAAASQAALSAASGARLLHIAAHVDGSTLPLSDGAVSADAALPTARVVVLASCGAAAGRDDAGHGSLATAFLDAGAEAVLATPWVIADADARRVVEAFYLHGGVEDAARGLAAAQRSLIRAMPDRSWAGFEILVGRPSIVR